MTTEHNIQDLLFTSAKPQEPTTTTDQEKIARLAKRYNYEVYDRGLEQVLPTAAAFLSALSKHEHPRWFTILGPSGCGKTYLMRQMLRSIRSIWQIPTRNGGWRDCQVAHLIPGEDLIDWKAPRDYASYDLIYLEDIGAGADDRAGSGAVLRSRINELLQLRSGRWTMIDANLTVADVADRLDQRIASRLKRDGSWLVQIPMDVPDYWWRDEAEKK